MLVKLDLSFVNALISFTCVVHWANWFVSDLLAILLTFPGVTAPRTKTATSKLSSVAANEIRTPHKTPHEHGPDLVTETDSKEVDRDSNEPNCDPVASAVSSLSDEGISGGAVHPPNPLSHSLP